MTNCICCPAKQGEMWPDYIDNTTYDRNKSFSHKFDVWLWQEKEDHLESYLFSFAAE